MKRVTYYQINGGGTYGIFTFGGCPTLTPGSQVISAITTDLTNCPKNNFIPNVANGDRGDVTGVGPVCGPLPPGWTIAEQTVTGTLATVPGTCASPVILNGCT
jgi:hypothetical protein